MKKPRFFAVLTGITALTIILGACGNSTGGIVDDPLTYSGKAGSDTYTLTITKATGRAFTPAKGDGYELTVGTKKSTGTVSSFNIDSGEFVLQPSVKGAEPFTATVSEGGNLESFTGSIIYDGETEPVSLPENLEPLTLPIIGVVIPEGVIWQPEMFTQAIKAKGYTAQVKGFSPEDNQLVQNAIIMELLNNGAKAILVNWAYGKSIETVIKEAEAKGVPIITTGRPILNIDSDAYNHNVTVDGYKIGEAQGKAIADRLKLATATGPFNIALFGGSATDSGAEQFYDGAIRILAPYINSNKLNVVGPYPTSFSDTANFAKIEIKGWYAENAKTMMEDLLEGAAKDLTLHAVLSPNDNSAAAMIEALEADSKYTGKTIDNGFPIITGQDANHKNLIEAGKLYMSIAKYSAIAKISAELADKLIKGQSDASVSGIPSKPTNNGAKDIKTYLWNPVVITKDTL